MAGGFTQTTGFGILCGLTTAGAASVGFVSARAGFVSGLETYDIVFMRFVVAGPILLPFLIALGLRGLSELGWHRVLVLGLTGGPLFALLQTGGYAFAPLAHGAVIAPSTLTIASTLVAGIALGERLSTSHLVGAAVGLVGVLSISLEGFVHGKSGPLTWLGDLMFAGSSLLWVVFTIQVRRWRIDAIHATAVAALSSAVVVVPAYLVWFGAGHLASLPTGPLLLQGVTQGLVQGVIGLIAYSRAVHLLGVSRAVLFPTIVPAASVLSGIPVLGEMPTPLQVFGLVLSTVGLLIAVGAHRMLPARRAAP